MYYVLSHNQFCNWLACIFLLSFIPSFVHCELIFSENPITVLFSTKSKVSRPEGVVFTPDGDYILVANSGSDSLTAYQRVKINSAKYFKKPVWQSSTDLFYVHDVSFNQSGNYLGIVCRESHVVVVFEKNDTENGIFQMDKVWQMQSNSHFLNYPAGLAFCLSNDTLSVVNRMGGNGINLYHPLNTEMAIYEKYPNQQISEEELLNLGLAAPHGAAFSHDGQYLAVLHKKFLKNKNAQGKSALAIYKKDEQMPFGYHSEPVFVFKMDNENLHSIDFHPSDKYIAVTHEKNYALIFERIGNGAEYQLKQETPRYYRKDIQKRLKSKGVAFSRQGDCLAITFENDLVVVYRVMQK